jgi:hypothetical protein
MAKVKEIAYCTPDDIPQDVLSSNEPIILKGLVDNWPIVKAANKSAQKAAKYLSKYYQGMTVGLGYSDKVNNGRFFYNNDYSGFNFTKKAALLDDVLSQLIKSLDDKNADSFYVGSTHVDKLLPHFREENDLGSLS